MPIPAGAATTATTLCTVAEAKTQIDKTSTVDDTELLAYCEAVVAPIEEFCGALLPRDITEQKHACGSMLALNEDRVITISSVIEYVGPTGYAYTQAATPTASGIYGFIPDPSSPSILRRFSSGQLTDWLGGEVFVTYTAGLLVIPTAINVAARMVVADMWETQQGGAGLPPVFDDDTITYNGMEGKRSRRAYELLSRYRRVGGIA